MDPPNLQGMMGPRLCDLPLFRDLKDELEREREKSKLAKSTFRPRISTEATSPAAKIRHFVTGSTRRPIPLAAYNTFEAKPYLPKSNQYSDHFDEMALREEQELQHLREVRTFGWDYFLPLGVHKTVKEIYQEHRTKEQKAAQQEVAPALPDAISHASSLPSAVQENNSGHNPNDYSEHSLQDSGMPEEPEIEEEQEDEISYNYEDEYNQVEGDHIEDVPAEIGPHSSRRGISIQQFVEDSHRRQSSMYGFENEYEDPRMSTVDSDTDAHDFTEVPSITISEIAQSSNGERMTSLGSTGTP